MWACNKMGALVHGFLLVSVAFPVEVVATQSADDFTYNGFSRANVSLDGLAEVSLTGLLRLTNTSGQGHAFQSLPLRFRSSPGGNVSSFSTTFVFAIVSELSDLGGHGLAFVLSPTRGRPRALPVQYLGLFNAIDNGDRSNHVVAVEMDIVESIEFADINDNHVGIDVNGLRSISSAPAAYFSRETGRLTNLTLMSGDPMQVWIEFDGAEKLLNVTLCPTSVARPSRPLLSSVVNLSSVILDTMYVGFSSGAGQVITNHYILGWSFKMNGEARPLDLTRLPPVPPRVAHRKSKHFILKVALAVVLGLLAVASAVAYYKRRKKFEEIREDWEATYASQRFSYRELYTATKGFSAKRLLGAGGFGSVYRGLIYPNTEIAVKRVSHESTQGVREFVAEIVTIGQLRHRNLVRLLGYCRRKGELLLVYEFMPNGSLDKRLFDQPTSALSWSQRFRIIKGIAVALRYLHEEWVRVVIHRDVKSSNILLDGELIGRLGDFGLARLHDHGSDPRTTRVVGTLGYLAPEVHLRGKATTSADVFAFGALVLEIACGRRAVETEDPPDQASEVVLVEWVSQCWESGAILEARDPKLRGDYVVEEMELALRLGLICSHPEPTLRPSMRQVVQYLEEGAPLPEMSKEGGAIPALAHVEEHLVLSI